MHGITVRVRFVPERAAPDEPQPAHFEVLGECTGHKIRLEVYAANKVPEAAKDAVVILQSWLISGVPKKEARDADSS